MVKLEPVNLRERLRSFDQLWSPKIVGEVNDSYVKLAKLQGEFLWHRHEVEDELFLVLQGTLIIRFRDGEARLEEGDMIVVPRGVEHLPIAEGQVHVLLFEPKSTLNTGNVRSPKTVDNLERI